MNTTAGRAKRQGLRYPPCQRCTSDTFGENCVALQAARRHSAARALPAARTCRRRGCTSAPSCAARRLPAAWRAASAHLQREREEG